MIDSDGITATMYAWANIHGPTIYGVVDMRSFVRMARKKRRGR